MRQSRAEELVVSYLRVRSVMKPRWEKGVGWGERRLESEGTESTAFYERAFKTSFIVIYI